MNPLSRPQRTVSGIAVACCAGYLTTATSITGVATVAWLGSAFAAASEPLQHVTFRDSAFVGGDIPAASAYLRRTYPLGQLAASDVVADLKSAGATCRDVTGLSSCTYGDRFDSEGMAQFATWTILVGSGPDGVLASIDVTLSPSR
jgi:hypothetical protein